MKTYAALYADLQSNRRHLVRERNLLSDYWIDDNESFNQMAELAIRNLDLAIDEIDYCIGFIEVPALFSRQTDDSKVGD